MLLSDSDVFAKYFWMQDDLDMFVMPCYFHGEGGCGGGAYDSTTMYVHMYVRLYEKWFFCTPQPLKNTSVEGDPVC